ncbi:scaffold protein ILK-like [Styela clava]|uniref:integrin-linked protein kinase-like n=2 Tax=Styela clava TaxID=7725 RepID=UPI00193A9701|nr:integrin-linked protein kinase-like [Styela clava]
MNDIFSACRDGNLMAVKVWLDNTENDLNQGDDHLFSPLHWASRYGHNTIVEMLLSRGARVNSANMGDDTPLHNAAQMGRLDVIHKLIREKAEVNALNEHGNTPLHYACFNNHPASADELVSCGALVSMCNKKGETPLARARPELARRLAELARSKGQDLKTKIPFSENVWKGTTRTRAKNGTMNHENVDLRQLNLKGKIASSHSGETWKGRWGQTEILAKILAVKNITSRISRAFHEEYLRLRIFSNPNVLPVMGIVNSKNLATISPYASYGSLYHVLHESTTTVDQSIALRFAIDIASGMQFLHSLEPMIDRLLINSKHIMIDEGMTCKVNMGDAGFSFQPPGKLYNPAWMAPEALQKKSNEINRKSADMWSFSILLWEMATREVPFSDLANMECGMRIALEGMRVSIPPGVSPHLMKLMRICMNEDPAKRPKFDMILPILQKMVV